MAKMLKKAQGQKRTLCFEDSDDIVDIESHGNNNFTTSKRGRIDRDHDGIVGDETGLVADRNDTSNVGDWTRMRNGESSSSPGGQAIADDGPSATPRTGTNFAMSPSIQEVYENVSAFREVGKHSTRGISDRNRPTRGEDVVSHEKTRKDPYQHCVPKYSRLSGSAPSSLSTFSYQSNSLVPVSVVTKGGALPSYDPLISDTARWQQTASSMTAAAYYAPYNAYYQHFSPKSRDAITMETERYMYMARWLSRVNPNSLTLSCAMDKSAMLLNPNAFRNRELSQQATPISASFPPHPEAMDSNHLFPAWPPRQQTTSGSNIFPLPSSAPFDLPPENWCAKCNASFRMTSDLVYHMRTHHKRNEPEENAKKGRVDRKLVCTVCNETFRERHHLTRHMTSHVNG